jgi:hypothetical protein
MADITDCYLIVFTDEVGMLHCVPFAKQEGGNAKANRLLETVRAIGLTGEKYGPYTRPN